MKKDYKNNALKIAIYTMGTIATLLIVTISCVIAYGLVHQNLNLLTSTWLKIVSIITVVLSVLHMFVLHFYNTYCEKIQKIEGGVDDDK